MSQHGGFLKGFVLFWELPDCPRTQLAECKRSVNLHCTSPACRLCELTSQATGPTWVIHPSKVKAQPNAGRQERLLVSYAAKL